MNKEDRKILREAALAASAATPVSVQRGCTRWELQTSNSFRRIGCHGDGDVLCGTTHPRDGHPDLLAPRDVLEYIVAAQPRAVLELLTALEAAEDHLKIARSLDDKLAAVEKKRASVAFVVAAIGAAAATLTDPSSTAEAVGDAHAIIAQLTSRLQEAADLHEESRS